MFILHISIFNSIFCLHNHNVIQLFSEDSESCRLWIHKISKINWMNIEQSPLSIQIRIAFDFAVHSVGSISFEIELPPIKTQIEYKWEKIIIIYFVYIRTTQCWQCISLRCTTLIYSILLSPFSMLMNCSTPFKPCLYFHKNFHNNFCVVRCTCKKLVTP